MADIRINALATTAASTASDDYIAIDGSANGTRKLNAYSPTFGGNLAANGTGAFGGTVSVSTGAGGSGFSIIRTGAAPSTCTILNTGGEIISDYNGVNFRWDLGGVTKLTLGSSAATLAGNLTVSGTGTSSFGGEPSTGAATHSGNLRIQSTGNGPAAVNGIELQNSQSGSGYAYKIYTNNSNDYLGIAGRFNSATWTEFAVFKQNTGNLLLGTTTDSSSGKLQLASSTSNSGGIGFGSDVTVFRSGNKTLNIETSAHTTYVAFAPESSIWMQQNYASGFDSVLRLTRATVADWDFVAGTDLVIKRNNTTALTLDSSQNATFAGNILAGTTTSVARTTVLSANSATTNDLVFTYNAAGSYRNGIGNNFNSVLPGYNEMAFLVNAGVDTTTQNKVLSLYGDKSATFAGAVRSNAQEGFKIAAASGYFAGYEADGTTLNGYLQFINSTGTLLNQSIAGKNIALAIAGTPQLTLTTGNATFAGGIIGMTQGNVDNISDDGVASFTPLYNRGFIVINNPDYSQNALIAYFKAGSSYLLYSITKSADVTLNNSTTLTGTTGTDGKLNIGYNNSIIYIENRLGGIGNFQRYALGGTNN